MKGANSYRRCHLLLDAISRETLSASMSDIVKSSLTYLIGELKQIRTCLAAGAGLASRFFNLVSSSRSFWRRRRSARRSNSSSHSIYMTNTNVMFIADCANWDRLTSLCSLLNARRLRFSLLETPRKSAGRLSSSSTSESPSNSARTPMQEY
jgi:hypothetical protein